MNILIVDNFATNRKLLRLTLEAEGHMAFEAADDVEARQILASERVDAIISYILMPTRKSERVPALPFIIFTTYTSPGDMRLAQTIGADDYFTKPAPIAEMLNTLRDLMDKKAVRPRMSGREVEETYVLKVEIRAPQPAESYGANNQINPAGAYPYRRTPE